MRGVLVLMVAALMVCVVAAAGVVFWLMAPRGSGPTASVREAPVSDPSATALAVDAGSDAGPSVQPRLHGVVAGFAQTCALRASGVLACWGRNGVGQLGFQGPDALEPRDVGGLPGGVLDVASGMNHTCASMDSGAVMCWGHNGYGQLADGSVEPRHTPGVVTGVFEALELSATGEFTCARRGQGTVMCWGDNAYGRRISGPNMDPPIQTTAWHIDGIDDAAGLATTSTHACVLRATGGVMCWGLNIGGQLGDGTTDWRTAPAPVVGLDDAVEVAAASQFTCARRAAGAVVCWGTDDSGQLGRGAPSSHPLPADVIGLPPSVVQLAAGGHHVCALHASGEVSCWGSNADGQLGTGTPDELGDVGHVVGLDDAIEITAGEWHTCARRRGGEVMCWGRNSSGQLGDGTRTSRRTPVAVVGL